MLVEIILGLKKSSTKGALGRCWVNLKIFSIRKKYSRASTNGHLSTTATSLQRPPLYNGHLATTATSLQRPPRYNGHLSTTATSLQRPPLYNGHLATTATSLQRPPRYNGHLSTTATSLQRPPRYNGHLSTTATFFGGQSIHSLLFQPLSNGHFILSPRWPL